VSNYFWRPFGSLRHVIRGSWIELHRQPFPLDFTALCGASVVVTSYHASDLEWLKARTCIACYNAAKNLGA
jgi:hypothetical protein